MNMKENINRREFLKQAGAGTAAVGAVALAGACAPKKTAEAILDYGSSEDGLENGKMEMRENPGNGDMVSLLGYGCMRFTMKVKVRSLSLSKCPKSEYKKGIA